MSDDALERLRARFPRVAVVHDWLTVPGGSEQIVIELVRMFPQAELFTTIYDPAPWPEEITSRPVHVSFLDRVPGARRQYPKLLPWMNRAFSSFDLSGYDLVLSSSHACAKNVPTPAHALHVCYCHTPIRYAWDPDFLRGEAVGPIAPLLSPLLAHLRRQDVAGAAGVDCFIANSQNVADRIERYYGRRATVVHPPIDVDHFLALPHSPEPYYLSFGRVVPYKRVDLLVAACERLGRPLKVAGDGRAMPAARAVAGPHTEFLGRVDDDERDRLLGGARALLFAAEEDFGIVPVEAQAAGVPVIAYGVGGARESVLDGETGVLYPEQAVDSLCAAITRFETLSLRPGAPRENAARFGRDHFRTELTAAIEQAARARASGT